MLIAVKRYILIGCHGMRFCILPTIVEEEESALLPFRDFHGLLFHPISFFL
jgi:hypothetical protein